jgi:hypothetical protein
MNFDPDLTKAYNQPAKDVLVIAINGDDPVASLGDLFEELVPIAGQNRYKFPYLLDETQGIAKANEAANTQHVFV